MSADAYKDYILATNELLLEFAREAKQKADSSRGKMGGDFDSGYLMGFHRVVSLMQQQAEAFGLETSDIGLGAIDANRDLT